MSGWWIADLLNDPNINGRVWVVSWAVWVIASICLHELAHGWVAIKHGDDTPILTGHMTWNPIVHMGPFSLIMFAFIGIAWGMMPINPSKLRGRYAESVVALAGPLMNLGLAALSLLLLILWVPLTQGQLIPSVTVGHPLSTNMRTFLHLGAMLNIVLLVFNMLPFPPLDGARIAMDVFPAYRRAVTESDTAKWLMLGCFVIFWIFGGTLLFVLADATISGISGAVWRLLFPSLSV